MVRTLAVVLVAVMACGTGDEAANPTTNDPDPTADIRRVPDGVACGVIRCIPGTACVFHEGELRCVLNRTDRPHYGALVMECDGHEDCAPGTRCMAVRGENDVFRCSDQCDSLLSESICRTDDDCRRCENLAPDTEVLCAVHPRARGVSVCTGRFR